MILTKVGMKLMSYDQVPVESGGSDGSFVQVTGEAMAHGKQGRNCEIAGGGSVHAEVSGHA